MMKKSKLSVIGLNFLDAILRNCLSYRLVKKEQKLLVFLGICSYLSWQSFNRHGVMAQVVCRICLAFLPDYLVIDILMPQ